MPADITAREILRRAKPDPIGAEIGVRVGNLSRVLAPHCKLLYMVDCWAPGDRMPAAYRATNDSNAHRSQQLADRQHERAMQAVAHCLDRVHIVHEFSAIAATQVPGGLDFVFIDADHSYEGARQDIECWCGLLRPGGLLGGHDYANPRFPDVKQAVDDAVALHHWALETGANYTWFVNL